MNLTPIPRVYVAGAYTAPTRDEREENVHRAIAVACAVVEAGCYPVVPHLVGFNTEHVEDAYEFWIEATKDELQTCHACVMAPGWHTSKGSQGEHTDCLEKRRPVFEAEWARVGRRIVLPEEFHAWAEAAKGERV